MASVFEAEHVRNGNRVAIKVLHPEVAAMEDARRRFLQEGYVANRVGHPGVVRALDDGVDGPHAYLVMEILSGKALWDIWEANGDRLDPIQVEPVLVAVLEILVAAHAAGVVHRDLKPDNIFLTTSGEVRLLDFGIAHVRSDDGGHRKTGAGEMMGTPAFMPAEQALGKWDEVDARADVYAVGASAYMLLTGRTVHVADTLPQLLVATATKPATPIRAYRPDLPERLTAVIDRAVAFAKEDRWQTASAMLDALRPRPVPAALVAAPVGSALDGWESAPTVVAALLSSAAVPTPRTPRTRAPWGTAITPLAVATAGSGAQMTPASLSVTAFAAADGRRPLATLESGRIETRTSRGRGVALFFGLVAAAGVAAASVIYWISTRPTVGQEGPSAPGIERPATTSATNTPDVVPSATASSSPSSEPAPAPPAPTPLAAPSGSAPPSKLSNGPPPGPPVARPSTAPKPPEDCKVGFDGVRRCGPKR